MVPTPFPRHTSRIDIGFRRVDECVAKPCGADCITSIGWKRSPDERER